MKHTFLFAVIASILSTGAYAVSATVTSKDYVDTQDALKQDLIPEAGVNAEENGGGVSVVTYTEDGDGVLGERGIYELSGEYDYGNYDPDTDGDKLVTAETLRHLPEARVTYKTCYGWSGTPHTDANCLLWELGDVPIRAWQCETDADCRGYSRYCSGIGGECFSGMCGCGE